MNIKAFSKRTMAIATGMVLSACCLLGDKVTLSAAGSFDIELSAHTDGYGSVSLDWSDYNYEDKNFKVYKSDDGGSTYETIGIDYTLVDEVRCLQIGCTDKEYPNGTINQYKTWMETNGYGKGIIKVDYIDINEFNSNYNSYLKDFNGNYKYDVIFFGTWNTNNFSDLRLDSRNAVAEFIESGRGCIMGHDCTAMTFLPQDNNSGHGPIPDCIPNEMKGKTYGNIPIEYIFDTAITPYLATLCDYFGITYDYEQVLFPDTQVVIEKDSLFTRYPWYIGSTGDILNIPQAHLVSQIASGANVFLTFKNGKEIYSNERNFYLAVKGNCAQIMTGHSNGAATEDEQKILANLIFYCNQLIFDTWYSKDSSAQDFAAPDAPTISLDINKIFFSAEDNGSTYHYYVESFDKNDTSESGLIDRSPVKSLTVTTGVQKYLYILDDNENTVVSKENGMETTDMNIPMNRDFTYIHVAAIDGAGNLSETTTMTIPKNTVNVKTNIKQPVSVNIKMLDDNGGYNGIQYNVSANEFGKVIKHMPAGRFEIQIIDRNYELSDIFIEDNTNNIYTIKENEKYYLIIDNSTKDEVGTIRIELNEKFNYQLDSSMNNYFR